MRISGFGSAAFGLIMAAGTGLPARAQTIKNMTTLGTYLRPGTVQASAGIWGWTGATGKEYALLTSRQPGGVDVVDITNPAAPKDMGFIPSTGNSIWHEVHSYRNYVYKVSQENSDGLQIIDMSPLNQGKAPVLVKSPTTWFKTAHTLFVDTTVTPARLFVAYESTAGVMIFTLEDPVNPKLVRSIVGEAHDMYGRGDRLYVSNQFKSTLTVWNIANVAAQAPVKVAVIDFNAIDPTLGEPAKGISHNSWPSDDNRYLFTTEETAGTTIKAWDISDISLTRPPKLVGKYIGVKGVIGHNVFVKGSLLYVAHYTAGVRILDISDPANMKEIAFHRPSASKELFGGTWGVYPWFKSGNIIHGDDVLGLFVEKPDLPIVASRPVAGSSRLTIAPLADGSLRLRLAGEGAYELIVRSTNGRELFHATGPAGDGVGGVDLHGRLGPGSYLAQLRQGGLTAAAPLILDR
jgi:choice-of-anchor B domain-containing protein